MEVLRRTIKSAYLRFKTPSTFGNFLVGNLSYYSWKGKAERGGEKYTSLLVVAEASRFQILVLFEM